jgi:hypothetical protein
MSVRLFPTVSVSGYVTWIRMTSYSNMAMYLSFFLSKFILLFHYFLHFFPLLFLIYHTLFWFHKSINYLDQNNKYQLLNGTFYMYLQNSSLLTDSSDTSASAYEGNFYVGKIFPH